MNKQQANHSLACWQMPTSSYPRGQEDRVGGSFKSKSLRPVWALNGKPENLSQNKPKQSKLKGRVLKAPKEAKHGGRAVTLVLGRLKQEGHKLTVSQAYLVRPCQKIVKVPIYSKGS